MEELIVALLKAFSGGHLEVEEVEDHCEEQMHSVLEGHCEREDRLGVLEKRHQSEDLRRDWNRGGEQSKLACAFRRSKYLYQRHLRSHQCLPRCDPGLDALKMTYVNHSLTDGSVAGPEVEVEELLSEAMQTWGSLVQEEVLD